MAENNEDQQVQIGEEKFTLAQLSGLDFGDVKELRGFEFPKGVYVWEIDGEKPPARQIIADKLAVPFALKCLDVIAVNDNDFHEPPESLIGKIHRETFFITTPESFGYLKAFLVDVGANAKTGKIDDVLAGSVGVRFKAGITKKKDPNNSDIIRTNISRNKIEPQGKAEASEVAKAIA